MKNTVFIVSTLLIIILFTNCNNQKNSQNETEINSSSLSGAYLSQKPPGITPEIFAAGIISRDGFEDYGITFSKNNDLVLYTCDTAGSDKHNIVFCELETGKWTAPKPIPFSFTQSIGEPVYSPISDKIFFSQLILNGKNELEPYLHFTKKTENGWESPELIMSGLFVSESNTGTLYFTDVTRGEKPMEKADIVKSEFVNGKYMEPELVIGDINTEYHEFHPFIVPDESYMIFDSNKPEGFGDYDIYISFKNKKNEWGVPINLGNKINSSEYEGVATLSHDGKYLFYCHNQDIYWVSTKILEDLKTNDPK